MGGRAYFISQGEPVNCWQWLNEILGLAGLQEVTRSISLPAAWRLGAACEAVWRLTGRRSDPPMTRFLAAQLGHSHYFDVSAATRDFGYRPEISIEEGMERLGQELAVQHG